MTRSKRNKSVCRSCSQIDRIISEEHKKKISLSKLGSVPWNKGTTGKMNIWNKGKTGIYSSSYIKKLSDSHKGQKSPMLGKHHSEETRKKLRISRCKWILEIGGGPQFNPKACKFLDGLNSERGWNLRHAMNGGEFYVEELGYWLDGYDELRNIIVEYDESSHERNPKKKRDKIRQEEIISCLTPKRFFRYNERCEELREII